MEPAVFARLCRVAPVANPQINACAAPRRHGCRRDGVVADRTHCPNAIISHGFCEESSECIRSGLRVVIEQPNILSAVRESVANSDIVTCGKTQIFAALKQEDVRTCSLDPRNGIVSGTVVDN